MKQMKQLLAHHWDVMGQDEGYNDVHYTDLTEEQAAEIAGRFGNALVSKVYHNPIIEWVTTQYEIGRHWARCTFDRRIPF